jgi:DNA modification methylase
MKWTTEKRKVNDLIPYDKNPRQMTDKQNKDLTASLKKFDLVEIPAINKDGTILAGHQRLRIMQSLGRGDEEIDVRVPDRQLSEKDVQEYNIRSNKNTGEWNFDELANSFEVDDLLKWGFEEFDLSLDSKVKEDDVPDLDEGEPIAKLGDIYQLGNHRIMCADATSEEDVAKLMAESKAQMTFTDPPYNVDYTGGMGTHEKNDRGGILNDKMSKEDFYQFLLAVNNNICEYTLGGIYICMSSSELDTLKTSFEQAGGHWQSFIIWVKDNFTLSRSDYQHLYEPILYGWNGKVVNHYFIQHRDNPNVWESLDKLKSEFDGTHTIIKFHGFEVKILGKVEGEVKRKKQKNDIWRYNKPTKSEEHPTMKPVKLCAEAIKNSSKPNDIVMDLFLGSGSTLIACEQLGRRCYGLELDPKYIDVIIKRWEQFTGEKAVKL